MIFTAFFNLIFDIIEKLFDLLPDFSVDLIQKVVDAVTWLVRLVLYFLPVDAVKIVLSYIMFKYAFKLSIAFVRFFRMFFP